MGTIYDLQKRAKELRDKRLIDSITPDEVGGLHCDTLSYIAELERGMKTLGIRVVYATKAQMLADKEPRDVAGNILRFGQLAVIYDKTNTAYAENGNVYAWQCEHGWLEMGNINYIGNIEQRIDELAPKEITWSNSANLAQWTFRFPGIYDIKGERTNKNDGFPIDNAASGHTINARLIVLDSSLPQASDTPQEDDACITQILMLSNRMGGEGNIYIRSARGHIDRSKWPADGSNFTPWIRLQGNMEVGATYSLDSYTDNGMVSGVHIKSAEDLETFVLIVINNYPAVGAVGNIVSRSVSQFKYAVDLAGNVTYKSRVKIGDSAWSTWVALATEGDIKNVKNELTTAMDAQRKELIKRIQGTSDNSSASKDAFKVLGSYTETTLGELISAMDAMHADNANSGYEGVWRAYIGNDYITIRNIPVGYTADKWMQIVSGRFTPDHNGNPIMVTQYREWVRTHNYNYDDFADIEGWSAWQKTTKQFDTDIANLHSEIKTIDNAISVVSKQLGTFSVISELLGVLDGMCPQGGENSYEKYIAYVGKEQVTVENNRRVDGATTVWHQTLRCHRRLSSVRNSKNIVYGDGGTGILIDYAQSFDFPSYSPTTSLYHDNTVYGEYCRKKIYYSTSATKENGVWNRWEDMSNPYRSMQSYAKRIAIFGGSFVQYMGGVWESVDTSKYAFTHAGRRYFLVDYLAERLNAKYFDDYAVGGNGNSVTTDSAGTHVFAYNTYFQVERSFNTDRTTPANQLDDNSNVYDIYIIMLGINDYAKNIEVGKATDDKNLSGTSATFCSSLKKSIDYIRANAPNAKILMITPFKAYKYSGNTVDFGWNPDTYTTNDKGYKFLDYVRAFKEVAYVTSCPCYDLLSMQNFSAANVDMYYTDGTHPNGLGYYKVADMLAEFIATGVGHGLNFNKTDDALSLTSTNAVQNKVVKAAFDSQRSELIKLLQGISENSMPSTDAFRFLGRFSTFTDLQSAIDCLIADSWNSNIETLVGFYRARCEYSFYEVINNLMAMDTGVWVQTIRGPLSINQSDKMKIYKASSYNEVKRTSSLNESGELVWGQWDYV